MSGIGGIWAASPGEINKGLDGMQRILDTRGPDGTRRWSSQHAGVLHASLVIDPLDRTDLQPLVDPDAGFVVVSDARLYNRRELWSQHGIDASGPDSAAILAAYRRWGASCAERLEGDFAFVIHDVKRCSFFCARDAFGSRPLYYTHREGKLFAFASSLKALLTSGTAKPHLNEDVANLFVAGRVGDEDASFCMGIHRLPPAHALLLERGRIRAWRYWDIDPYRELHLRSDDEYAEAVRVEFERAVRIRLPATGRVGVTVSGGLDSSSVAAVARELLPGNAALYAVSGIVRAFPECDEQRFVHDLVEYSPGIQLREVFPHANVVEHLDEALGRLEEPHELNMHYFEWQVFAAAAQLRCQVVLTGNDGDRVVSHGEGYSQELAQKHRFRRLFAELQHEQRPISWSVARAARMTALAHAPDPVVGLYRAFRYGMQSGPDLRGVPATRAVHYHRLRSPTRSWPLALEDQLGAVFRMEARHPFYDRTLAQLCLSLPAIQKRRNGVTRFAMRAAMAGSLPASIRQRANKGDYSAFHERAFGRLILERGRIVADGPPELVRMRQRKRVIRMTCGNPSELRWPESGVLWRSCILALWWSNLIRQTKDRC